MLHGLRYAPGERETATCGYYYYDELDDFRASGALSQNLDDLNRNKYSSHCSRLRVCGGLPPALLPRTTHFLGGGFVVALLMEDAHERPGWEEVLPPAELTAFCESMTPQITVIVLA